MTKEEFKAMFLECFTLDVTVDWDGWLRVSIKDADTSEVLLDNYVSSSDIVRTGTQE